MEKRAYIIKDGKLIDIAEELRANRWAAIPDPEIDPPVVWLFAEPMQ